MTRNVAHLGHASVDSYDVDDGGDKGYNGRKIGMDRPPQVMVQRNDLIENLIRNGNKDHQIDKSDSADEESTNRSEIGSVYDELHDKDDTSSMDEDDTNDENSIENDVHTARNDDGDLYNHLGKVIDKSDRQNVLLSIVHNATGIAKSSLVKLSKAKAMANLPVIIDNMSTIDYENSPEWYKCHIKQGSPNKHGLCEGSKEKLEVVCLDIMAKFSKVSRRGNNYCYLFVDYMSRMIFPYFGANKSDLLSAMKQFKAQVVDVTDYKWKYLQSDSERVITEGRVKEYLSNQGISIRKSQLCRQNIFYQRTS
jgi:hypothetical protein